MVELEVAEVNGVKVIKLVKLASLPSPQIQPEKETPETKPARTFAIKEALGWIVASGLGGALACTYLLILLGVIEF